MSIKNYPSYLELTPRDQARGMVSLPGSKSISNRALILAALAQGTTQLKDVLASDDTFVMLNALRTLGVHWQQTLDTQHYQIEGTHGRFPVSQADLFMGNAGTAIRPLTAVLATMQGEYSLHGVPRMHERPIGDLVDALNHMGAQIQYTGIPCYPPIHIGRSQIQGHQLSVRGDISSQFLTALLIAAPLISEEHTITIQVLGELISKPYIHITLSLMRRFGIQVEQKNEHTFTIPAQSSYQSPGIFYVEGDASSASYFLAAGAITGGPVRVEGVGRDSIQGDILFVDFLKKMGADIDWGDNWIEVRSTGKLKGINESFNDIPDAAMTIAMLALYAEGETTLRNIGSWRVKETDRITAMATELRKLGATVTEGSDYLIITPPKQMLAAEIMTYDDHRMAMCFSLACLNGSHLKGAKIRIHDPKCVAKTFPEYFKFFDQLTTPPYQ